jgi:adenosylcobinamide-GDP ribazoletransferase
MRRLFAAVQFLTILPVPIGADPARGAVFFPAVGALVGALGGAVAWAAGFAFPPQIAALLALGSLLVITGGLHEDGLADVFDAFRAGRSPERIHEILKDSRIGTYGALALIVTLALRWQTIAMLGSRTIAAMAVAAGASRGAMVMLAATAKPAGEGLGKSFCLGLEQPMAILAGLQAAALPFVLGPLPGAIVLLANIGVIVAARAYFSRRIGGVTGDCLGALCQVSEILILLIAICPRFT